MQKLSPYHTEFNSVLLESAFKACLEVLDSKSVFWIVSYMDPEMIANYTREAVMLVPSNKELLLTLAATDWRIEEITCFGSARWETVMTSELIRTLKDLPELARGADIEVPDQIEVAIELHDLTQFAVWARDSELMSGLVSELEKLSQRDSDP